MAATICKGAQDHLLVIRLFPLLCVLTGAHWVTRGGDPNRLPPTGAPCTPGADECPAPLYCIPKTGRASKSRCGTCAAATSEEAKPLPQLIGMEWETNFGVTCDVPGEKNFVMCRHQAVSDASKGLYDAFLVAELRVGPYARAPFLAVTQDMGGGTRKTMELIGGPSLANKAQQTNVGQLATLVLRAVDALEPCYNLARSSKDYCIDKRHDDEKKNEAKAVRISQVRSWVNGKIRSRNLALPEMVYPEGCVKGTSNRCEEVVLMSFLGREGTTNRQANVAITLSAYSEHHSEILAKMPDKANECPSDDSPDSQFCRGFYKWASANNIYRKLSEQVGNILGREPFQLSDAVAGDHDVRGFFIYLLTYFTTLWMKELPSPSMNPYLWARGHNASDKLRGTLDKSNIKLYDLFGKTDEDHDTHISKVKNFWELLPKTPLDACLRAIAAPGARTELREWWGGLEQPFEDLSSFMCDGLIDVLFTDDVLPQRADDKGMFRMWLKGLCREQFQESQEKNKAIPKLRKIFDQASAERFEGETDKTYGYGYTRAEVNRILTRDTHDNDPATAALKPIPLFKMKTTPGGTALGMVLETRSSKAPWSDTLTIVRCASWDDEDLGKDLDKVGCYMKGEAITANEGHMAFYYDTGALAKRLTEINMLVSG